MHAARTTRPSRIPAFRIGAAADMGSLKTGAAALHPAFVATTVMMDSGELWL